MRSEIPKIWCTWFMDSPYGFKELMNKVGKEEMGD